MSLESEADEADEGSFFMKLDALGRKLTGRGWNFFLSKDGNSAEIFKQMNKREYDFLLTYNGNFKLRDQIRGDETYYKNTEEIMKHFDSLESLGKL